MVKNIATLLRRTGGLRGSRTRVLADIVYTGSVRGALVVSRAFVDFGGASYLSAFVHHETVFANARGTVVGHLALLVIFAFERRIRGARIETFACGGVTRQCGGTMGIFVAMRRVGGTRLRRETFGVETAFRVRHAHVTFRAGAPGSVHDRSTEGVQSASTAQRAWVNALVVEARLFVGAF